MSPPSRDHPRSRGVYWRLRWFPSSLSGSSPLARGLLTLPVRVLSRWGIIPARAGFTRARANSARVRRDHPRSRGVYGDPVGVAGTHEGSSPLARGLHGGDRPDSAHCGIIPARAGFTHQRPGRQAHSWDHPRSRGVYRRSASYSPSQRGSSPLARGLRRPGGSGRLRPGIIPARAGFTFAFV